jgi:hypothetical protein
VDRKQESVQCGSREVPLHAFVIIRKEKKRKEEKRRERKKRKGKWKWKNLRKGNIDLRFCGAVGRESPNNFVINSVPLSPHRSFLCSPLVAEKRRITAALRI